MDGKVILMIYGFSGRKANTMRNNQDGGGGKPIPMGTQGEYGGSPLYDKSRY